MKYLFIIIITFYFLFHLFLFYFFLSELLVIRRVYSALKIKSLYFLKTSFYGIKVIWLDSINYRDLTDI